MPVDRESRRYSRMSGSGSCVSCPRKPPGTTNVSSFFGSVAVIGMSKTARILGDARLASQRKTPRKGRAALVVRPIEADTGVVVRQDPLEVRSGLGHSEGADLAETYPVAPSLAGEDELR